MTTPIESPAPGRLHLAAGAALAVLAVAEAVLLGGSGTALALAVAVGLLATAPTAFARSHPVAAASTVTVAGAATIALYGRPALTAIAAALIVWAPRAARHHRRRRAAAAAREAGDRAARRTLIEYTLLGERARIARELHDIVAHHISMISVQAETARLTTPDLPETGAERFREIGDTARSALTEMRRLLGVLREDGAEAPARTPPPGLDAILDLVDAARDAGGVRARLIVRGGTGDLDPGIGLTAYRIVQEALSNVRRHAPGAAVDVELDRTAGGLRLRIRDNGPGPAGGDGGGHGLTGMRERTAGVGGSLRAGPGAHGGFAVEACFPGEDR